MARVASSRGRPIACPSCRARVRSAPVHVRAVEGVVAALAAVLPPSQPRDEAAEADAPPPLPTVREWSDALAGELGMLCGGHGGHHHDGDEGYTDSEGYDSDEDVGGGGGGAFIGAFEPAQWLQMQADQYLTDEDESVRGMADTLAAASAAAVIVHRTVGGALVGVAEAVDVVRKWVFEEWWDELHASLPILAAALTAGVAAAGDGSGIVPAARSAAARAAPRGDGGASCVVAALRAALEHVGSIVDAYGDPASRLAPGGCV